MTLEEKQQHDKEISDKFLLRDEEITEEEYAGLSIQDMCVLITNAKWLIQSGDHMDSMDKIDEMKDRIRNMHSITPSGFSQNRNMRTTVWNTIRKNAEVSILWKFRKKVS